MGKARNRSYKELTLSELRCFFETVRKGSFSAAAAALGVSHPTVLQQVRALESQLGAKLVEPHERGCSLTQAGRLLIELAGPSVETIDTLRTQFQAGLAGDVGALKIATTPRCLLEDLAPSVAEFCTSRPGASFTFAELDDDEVAGVVESRGADFGFTPAVLSDDQRLTLTAEPIYQLEFRLIAKAGHPLRAAGRFTRETCAPTRSLTDPRTFQVPRSGRSWTAMGPTWASPSRPTRPSRHRSGGSWRWGSASQFDHLGADHSAVRGFFREVDERTFRPDPRPPRPSSRRLRDAGRRGVHLRGPGSARSRAGRRDLTAHCPAPTASDRSDQQGLERLAGVDHRRRGTGEQEAAGGDKEGHIPAAGLRAAARTTGESAAPRLPHMLLHPRAEPACRPPTSWLNAQTDGTARSVATAMTAIAATTPQAEWRRRQARNAAAAAILLSAFGAARPHRTPSRRVKASVSQPPASIPALPTKSGTPAIDPRASIGTANSSDR